MQWIFTFSFLIRARREIVSRRLRWKSRFRVPDCMFKRGAVGACSGIYLLVNWQATGIQTYAGLGGLIAPFIGIKLIDIVISVLGLA